MTQCAKCWEVYPVGHIHECRRAIRMEEEALAYENPTLNEREKTHGDYSVTAICAQKLKDAIREAHFGKELDLNHGIDCRVAESLDLICTKLARIASGNQNEIDHWKDIAGYANLVSERLEK